MALVSEAMERRVVTVSLEATVGEAADLARHAGVDHLLVLDGEALAGVLCTCDLGGARVGELVADCMTLPVLTVRADAQLEDAATTMHECGVGCLPVVVGGLVLGILDDVGLERAGLAGHGAHARCHAHRRVPLAH
jgi:acetoin utilization protein AcuB